MEENNHLYVEWRRYIIATSYERKEESIYSAKENLI